MGILAAFKQAERESESLLAFLEAEQEREPKDDPVTFLMLRLSFNIAGNLFDFVKSANSSTIQALIRYLIPIASDTLNGVKLICLDRGKKSVIEAGWDISDMQTALRWMIWYDEFTKHPVLCCQECRTVFRGKTAHVRKFCDDYRCARRVSARKWRRKDLALKRTAKEAAQRKAKRDGTQKAR